MAVIYEGEDDPVRFVKATSGFRRAWNEALHPRARGGRFGNKVRVGGTRTRRPRAHPGQLDLFDQPAPTRPSQPPRPAVPAIDPEQAGRDAYNRPNYGRVVPRELLTGTDGVARARAWYRGWDAAADEAAADIPPMPLTYAPTDKAALAMLDSALRAFRKKNRRGPTTEEGTVLLERVRANASKPFSPTVEAGMQAAWDDVVADFPQVAEWVTGVRPGYRMGNGVLGETVTGNERGSHIAIRRDLRDNSLYGSELGGVAPAVPLWDDRVAQGVMTHELGHALWFASLWARPTVAEPGPRYAYGPRPRRRGPPARCGAARLGGCSAAPSARGAA